MPQSLKARAVATSLRAETAALVRLADRDLARLWRLVAAGANAGEALHDLLPAIVREYGAAGGAMAAEWYDQQREKVGAKGRFYALPVQPDDRGTHALVGWALATAKDDASLQSLILGGAQRRIADHARLTVTSNAVEDRAAAGWQRVTGGSACAFCSMLAGRGSVYSEATADFSSHDDCGCSATVAWRGEPVPVKPYTPSARNITDADRTRVSAYLDGKPASTKTKGVDSTSDVDASRTVAELRTTLAALEKSALKFESPGTRARIEELRRKIAARSR